MDLGEYPTIDTEQGPEPLEWSINFFLSNEVLGACYCGVDNIISIYSLCPRISVDLPYMKDVVYTIDHETMHWVLSTFVNCWSSWCFDTIARSIEKWLS